MKLSDHREEILNLFRCQGTGNCCRRDGVVYVTQEEIEGLAKLTGNDETIFRQKYVIRDGIRDAIATPTFRRSCFLNENNGCSVYEKRPKACRTYPDWPSIWTTDRQLLEESKFCEGLHLAIEKFLSKTK